MKTQHRIYVLKRISANIFFASLGLILMYYLFNSFFPKLVNVNNKYFMIIIAIIIFYLTVKNILYYKSLLSYLDRSNFIYEIKQDNNAKKRLYYFVMYYSERLERNKTKIDILKSLTPIPVIVFLLGLLLNANFNFLGENIANFITNVQKLHINFEQATLLSIFILMFYYLYEYRSAWLSYKFTLGEYFAFKYEYDTYEERNRK